MTTEEIRATIVAELARRLADVTHITEKQHERIGKLEAAIDELRRFLAAQPLSLNPAKGCIEIRDGRLHWEEGE